jgi:hypothetical protein
VPQAAELAYIICVPRRLTARCPARRRQSRGCRSVHEPPGRNVHLVLTSPWSASTQRAPGPNVMSARVPLVDTLTEWRKGCGANSTELACAALDLEYS